MWDWLDTTRGKRMLKSLTLGSLLTLLAAWGGVVYSHATLSERVERSREDISEMWRAMKDQTGLLHRIDNNVAVVSSKLDEHVKLTQNTDRR